MNSSDIQKVKQQFGIIGNDPELLRAIDTAIQVAQTDLSVLITGESGVGKEFFPKIIHTNSVRKHNKYIAVNCGAIPEGTIDSELFGHVKGAFTGAVNERKGYSKFHLRLELEAGAWLTAEMKRDTDTRWEKIYTTHNERARTVSIPVLPRRCDSVQIRLTGKGKCVLRTFIREFFTGSDV